ncbi:hypothetical protein KXV85_006083, partial [Aspergillus fumigatus]
SGRPARSRPGAGCGDRADAGAVAQHVAHPRERGRGLARRRAGPQLRRVGCGVQDTRLHRQGARGRAGDPAVDPSLSARTYRRRQCALLLHGTEGHGSRHARPVRRGDHAGGQRPHHLHERLDLGGTRHR